MSNPVFFALVRSAPASTRQNMEPDQNLLVPECEDYAIVEFLALYVISIKIHGSKDMETISKRFIKCLCKKNIGSKNLKYKEISNYY